MKKGRLCSGAVYCTPWLEEYPQLKQYLNKNKKFDAQTWLDTYARIRCYIDCINSERPSVTTRPRLCAFVLKHLNKINVERLSSPYKELIEDANLECFDFFDQTDYLLKSLHLREELNLFSTKNSGELFEKWYTIIVAHKDIYGSLKVGLDRRVRHAISSLRRRSNSGLLSKHEKEKLVAVDFPFYDKCTTHESNEAIFDKNFNAIKHFKDDIEGFYSDYAKPFIRVIIRRFSKGNLTETQIQLLEEINFPWDIDLTPREIKRKLEKRKRMEEAEEGLKILVKDNETEAFWPMEFDLQDSMFDCKMNLFAPVEDLQEIDWQ